MAASAANTRGQARFDRRGSSLWRSPSPGKYLTSNTDKATKHSQLNISTFQPSGKYNSEIENLGNVERGEQFSVSLNLWCICKFRQFYSEYLQPVAASDDWNYFATINLILPGNVNLQELRWTVLSNNIIGPKVALSCVLMIAFIPFYNYQGGSRQNSPVPIWQTTGWRSSVCETDETPHSPSHQQDTLFFPCSYFRFHVKMVEFKFCQNKTLKTPSVA